MTEGLDLRGWLWQKVGEAADKGELPSREAIFRVLYFELISWKIEEQKTIALDQVGTTKLIVRPGEKGKNKLATIEGARCLMREIDDKGFMEMAGYLSDEAAISFLQRVSLELMGAVN